MIGLRVLFVTMWFCLASAAQAQLGTTPHIRAELVAESMSPVAGAPASLAIVMTPQAGWHGYWKNPGDAGQETRTEWTLPSGVTAGAPDYPVPGRLLAGGLMQYVYERPYAMLVPLDVPAGLAAGTPLPIRLKLDWLECTATLCVPASATLALDLRVGDGQPTARADFERYRAALPRPLGSAARFSLGDGRFRLAIPLPAAIDASDAFFFPLTDGAIDNAAPQTVTRQGDRIVIETQGGPEAPGAITGVLALANGTGLSLSATPGEVASIAPPGGGDGTLLLALGGAVLGGLLLNVMPCVFPILSLKALGLARSGGSEAAARGEALAYAAGVILVCVALGGALLALRAGGSAAGWAFQLQDPRVILVLLLLTGGIALNLAGLFELAGTGAGQALVEKGGRAGAFWTGALAAFVATPCTGPFMGAALGAALVLPPAAAIAVFAGLGFGLALPFLAIGFVPALRRRLPRPGAWMGRFRRFLAIPMFATALGLAWILGRQAGVDGMTLGLAALLAAGLALWWYGRRQASGRPRAWLALLPGALVAAAAVATVVPQGRGPAASVAGREPFSESRLAALRAERRPVFVYFTADWCLTCKVNESTSIDRAEVAASFAAKQVAVLEGDWTDGDAAIGRFLNAHGRSGVPLYLFYPPAGEARELPQVLTPAMLTGLG
jgi:thiol:disulfide interchange protein